jgi:putative cell wall-binding protein
VDRIWGPDRYWTAAAVAEMAFDTADTVFLALGTNFPDALVAAAAGGYLDGPVLLTGKDTLPPATIAELQRLTPNTAYIVGGTAVIDPVVEQLVGSLVPNVIRLAGPDRYATAVAVSAAIFPPGNEAFLATGEDFPDALVAAAAAGYDKSPVLLTRRDGAPQQTLDELARLHPSTIYIVGGTAVISEAVAQQAAAYGNVVRLAGPDRYATAAAVQVVFGMNHSRAFLAYGRNFPDALVAAAAGGHLLAPVLLVEHDSIPAASMDEIWYRSHVWIVGGTAVIGDEVSNALP